LANAIVIYSQDFTPRHQYVFDLVFKELLGINYSVSQDIAAQECHINYSDNENIIGLNVLPNGLLSEGQIETKWQNDIIVKQWNNLPIFFINSSSGIPFDLFSAIFYCVSRYEEYLPFESDIHNRFTAENSFLLKHQLLDKPIVNQWVLEFKKMLSAQYPELQFIPRDFEYISTIDIDQAWKFKHKGLLRNLAGTFRDLIERKWENLVDRWPTLLGLKNDSFYNFQWQNQVHKLHKIKVKYFILLGDFGGFDKNISYKNKAFRSLIQDLSHLNSVDVGIHPSYKSNYNKKQVKKEIKRLKNITSLDVRLSRQHFLMHSMPITYQNLLSNGIEEEHTMGYSTHLGFRAGIAAPFLFFDLSKNTITKMRLFPFCAMDIAPLHYLNQTPDEAIETLNVLMNEVKKVGGLFISLWHNESFSETERWKGWKKVYEHLLTSANIID
jgi:hypothetical protein